MKSEGRAVFQKVGELLEKGGPALTEAEYLANEMLTQHPDDPGAQGLYASVLAVKGQYGAARILLQRAIKGRADIHEFHNNLGYCDRFLGLVDESREAYRKAIDLHPVAMHYANLAAMYVARGEAREGLEIINAALDMDPTDAAALNNKSVLLLERGKWEEGFGLYDSRLAANNKQEKHYHPNGTPMWDGTKGQVVVVHGEQGIGDEIMFASCLADIAKDCTLIFDCHDRLLSLFRASFPDMLIYGTKRENPQDLTWPGLYSIDAKLPIGSLPRFYRRRTRDFPRKGFLKAPDALKALYGERLKALGPRPKIGISWMGGKNDTHRRERCIPLKDLQGLFAMDADFISLQYDADAHHDVSAIGAPNVYHWPDVLTNPEYAHTAGLVANLDLVISVPQSVVHLAGALNVPTWQLTPRNAMWQMGSYPHDLPWYGSVKSYWQDDSKTWEPVIHRIEEALCSLLQTPIKT